MNKWEDPTRVVEIEVQLPKGGINNPTSSSLTDQPFRFGNSLTTFKPYRIWKEGHEGSGQNLSNAKRRYIWEFCSKSCNQGLQAQELLDKYVREAMQSKGNTESIKVTYDDIKTLIELIAQYSDVPRKTLREHIKFKEGVGIEVKSI